MRGALFALAAGLSAAVQLRDIQGGSLEPLDVPNDQCGVVVSAQEDDRLTLFAVGQDGQLWHKYKLPNANMGDLASGSTDGFTIWSSMGGSFLGGPSVVRDSRAKLMVFARGADRAIYMLEQQAPNSETWGHFTSLGGSMSSAPRAVLNSEARLTLTLTSSIALPARASTPPPRTTAAPPLLVHVPILDAAAARNSRSHQCPGRAAGRPRHGTGAAPALGRVPARDGRRHGAARAH